MPDAALQSPTKRWAARIALMLAAMLVSVVLVEIGLRVAAISYPSFYTVNEFQGAGLRPGAEGWWMREGKAYFRINSVGQRDREHTREKPTNSLRIAVLGDSYAEALQVPMEDTFWSVLESRLKNCPALAGRVIEVLNFGVSGFGTAQELMTLRHRAWDYSPDVVVLAFVTGNDLRNNVRALEGDPLRPYFIYQGDRLTLDASFRDAPGFRARQTLPAKLAYWAVGHSRVLQVFNEAKNRYLDLSTRSKLQRLQAQEVQQLGGEIGLDDTVYSEPKDPLWEEAWRVTEGLILLMRDEVREKGAEFLLVTLSTGIQVHPDPSVRQAFAKRLGVDELLYPDLRIQALGERHGFSVLNLVFPFRAYAEKHQVSLHGFENSSMTGGHWNAKGHHLAGELIAEKLCSVRAHLFAPHSTEGSPSRIEKQEAPPNRSEIGGKTDTGK